MYDLYYIEWEDATESETVWQSEKDAIEWAESSTRGLVLQVGWIIKETEEYLLIAGSVGAISAEDVQDLGQVFKIPTKWVKKKVKIKEKGK